MIASHKIRMLPLCRSHKVSARDADALPSGSCQCSPGRPSTASGTSCPGRHAAPGCSGVHPSCVYLLAGSELSRWRPRTRCGLPCAVRLAAVRADVPFAAVRRDDSAEVGDGLLRAGPVTVRVARWWSPRPPRAGRSAGRADRLTGLLAGSPSTGPGRRRRPRPARPRPGPDARRGRPARGAAGRRCGRRCRSCATRSPPRCPCWPRARTTALSARRCCGTRRPATPSRR